MQPRLHEFLISKKKMADAKELQSNLSQYRAQLEQVEAALTIDKDNEELKKLKQDLEEVITLTSDLLKVNEKSTTQVQHESSKWKVGGICQAVFSQDGNYYNATIDMISDDLTTCTVSFDTYGNTEIVKISSLRAPGGAAAPKRTFTEVGEASGSSEQKSRAEKDKVKDQKRKKMAKKQQRVKEIEEQREKEKNNWLDFFNNSKGSGSKSKSNKLKGISKKSIFASPEGATGKVGVGTCGIGGQPMTQYTQPDKLVYKR